MEDDDDPDRLWCYCKQPDGGQRMIWCDSCEYWYHCDCLGLEDSQIDTLVKDNIDFICYKCSGSTPPYGNLPNYPPLSPPSFLWGDVPGSEFVSKVCSIYDEVIHWRRNLFSVPVGKAGNRFVQELARLFQSFADGSALEGIALKAAMLMPILLLQKTSFKSRSRDDGRVLGRRLISWQQGDLESLLQEGRSIQHHLTSAVSHSVNTSGQFARRFAKLMMEGKLRAATRLIEDNADSFPLSLKTSVTVSGVTSTVGEILLEKHPCSRLPRPSVLLSPTDFTPPPFHPAIFDNLDGVLVRRTILRMDGAAGPSGMDVASWKKLCTSFRVASDTLCDAVSTVARRLATTFVDPACLLHLLLAISQLWISIQA